MITSAIPVIAVSDSSAAENYYCRVLGFQKMFAYPPDATKPDPRYLASLGTVYGFIFSRISPSALE